MLEGRSARLVAGLVLALVACAVYAGGLQGPFLFDDVHSIVEDPAVHSTWPPFDAREGSGASGRPLVALSFALNYAWGELQVYGYHAANLALHVLVTLLLFGFTRRATQRTSLAPAAGAVGFATALLWSIHPLTSDALLLVASRGEVLLAVFTLGTLYAADRAFDGATTARTWSVAAVLSCAGAMASKEVAVSLPLVVLAYDRTFVSASFREALRTRRSTYVALASTWIVLGLALATAERGVAVGFGRELSSVDYLRTQAQGLVHYLRLGVWPSGLAADYSGWPPVTAWGPALLPGALIVALFCASVWGFARRAAAGWVGLTVFAVLAPSSSVIPITGEWLAEHRMYLPLAGLVALAVAGAARLLQRLPAAQRGLVTAALLVLLAVPLARATAGRCAVWSDAEGLWSDVLTIYPENARAHDSLAALRLQEGRYAEALASAREAKRLDPDLYTVDYNLATILLMQGDARAALPHFVDAAPHVAGDYRFHANYGAALGQAGRREDAIRELRSAVAIAPDYAQAHRNLALLLLQGGEAKASLPHLRRVLQLAPDPWSVEAAIRLLASHPDPAVRDGREALQYAQRLTAGGATNPQSLDLLAMSFAELGRFAEAQQAAERALAGAQRANATALADGLEERLRLYREERPYRAPYQP